MSGRGVLAALAELANILGGNLHSVISSDSALGLPDAPAEPLPRFIEPPIHPRLLEPFREGETGKAAADDRYVSL